MYKSVDVCKVSKKHYDRENEEYDLNHNYPFNQWIPIDSEFKNDFSFLVDCGETYGNYGYSTLVLTTLINRNCLIIVMSSADDDWSKRLLIEGTNLIAIQQDFMNIISSAIDVTGLGSHIILESGEFYHWVEFLTFFANKHNTLFTID
jgi:hypothetical protein